MLGNETGFDMEKKEITKRSLSVWEPFFKQRNIHESVQRLGDFAFGFPVFPRMACFTYLPDAIHNIQDGAEVRPMSGTG